MWQSIIPISWLPEPRSFTHPDWYTRLHNNRRSLQVCSQVDIERCMKANFGLTWRWNLFFKTWSTEAMSIMRHRYHPEQMPQTGCHSFSTKMVHQRYSCYVGSSSAVFGQRGNLRVRRNYFTLRSQADVIRINFGHATSNKCELWAVKIATLDHQTCIQ